MVITASLQYIFNGYVTGYCFQIVSLLLTMSHRASIFMYWAGQSSQQSKGEEYME